MKLKNSDIVIDFHVDLCYLRSISEGSVLLVFPKYFLDKYSLTYCFRGNTQLQYKTNYWCALKGDKLAV